MLLRSLWFFLKRFQSLLTPTDPLLQPTDHKGPREQLLHMVNQQRSRQKTSQLRRRTGRVQDLDHGNSHRHGFGGSTEQDRDRVFFGHGFQEGLGLVPRQGDASGDVGVVHRGGGGRRGLEVGNGLVFEMGFLTEGLLLLLIHDLQDPDFGGSGTSQEAQEECHDPEDDSLKRSDRNNLARRDRRERIVVKGITEDGPDKDQKTGTVEGREMDLGFRPGDRFGEEVEIDLADDNGNQNGGTQIPEDGCVIQSVLT